MLLQIPAQDWHASRSSFIIVGTIVPLATWATMGSKIFFYCIVNCKRLLIRSARDSLYARFAPAIRHSCSRYSTRSRHLSVSHANKVSIRIPGSAEEDPSALFGVKLRLSFGRDNVYDMLSEFGNAFSRALAM